MQFYSTNTPTSRVSFSEAVLRGLAPDGGLYMPLEIPALDKKFCQAGSALSLQELAYAVLKPFVGSEIPEVDLKSLLADALDFPIPLVQLTDQLFVLELFHGPTLAFKDVAARTMARVMSYFNRGESRELTILVATSGDTGGAVASGFFDVEGIRVVVLYPRGRVTPIQEAQLTTLGGNVHALEVDGSFDDCQALVKQAFVDAELGKRLRLSSANSINICRLLPQAIYYFYALAQLPRDLRCGQCIVPSGNFGNVAAGLVAREMGAEIGHFVSATNANDVVPRYLQSGDFHPMESLATLSNAMDVGNPSNLVRIQELFHKEVAAIRKHLSAQSVSDDETREAIARYYRKHSYVFDPHGAVGVCVAESFLEKTKDAVITLAPAHPIKFRTTIEPLIASELEIPAQLGDLLSRKKQATTLPARFAQLRNFLLSL